MGTIKVLIIGGYGKVGAQVAKLLSSHKQIELTLGGRDRKKAEKAAIPLQARGIYIDVDDPISLDSVVRENDIIINCFIGTGPVNTLAAKTATHYGKHYLDVAGLPMEHLEAVLDLDDEARERGSIVITALGLYPGSMGVVLKSHADYFDTIDRSDVYFAMGSRMDELSLLSLQGVGQLMQTPAEVWNKTRWEKPQKPMGAKYIEAFDKTLYFGSAMVSPDIRTLPEEYSIQQLQVWSGLEGMLQGTVFMLGIGLGLAKSEKTGRFFLGLLQWLGRKDTFHHHTALEIITHGTKEGKPVRRKTTFRGCEVYLTALTAVIACRQIIDGKITSTGASYPLDVLDLQDFITQMEQEDTDFSDSMEINSQIPLPV